MIICALQSQSEDIVLKLLRNLQFLIKKDSGDEVGNIDTLFKAAIIMRIF